jgi:hypothetical protein
MLLITNLSFCCKVKVYCLLIKSESIGGFNLKSSYSYSVNGKKFTLQLKLEPTGKILIGGIVGL